MFAVFIECVHIYSYQNVSLQNSQVNGRKSEGMETSVISFKMDFSTSPSLPHVCLEQWTPAWKGSIALAEKFHFSYN